MLTHLIELHAKYPVEMLDCHIVEIPPQTKSLQTATSNDGFGFLFPLAGRARFRVGKEIFTLAPGTVFHATPNLVIDREVRGKNPWRYALLHYTFFADVPQAELAIKDFFTFPIHWDAALEEIILRIDANQLLPGALARIYAKSGFQKLMAKTFEASLRYQPQFDIVQLCLQYMQENYANEISVSELAAQYNIDRKRLLYLFQKSTGMSPYQYLIDYRLRKAKTLLRDTELLIADIAYMVGYPDSLYFSKLFKKHIGVSPSRYRASFSRF